MIQMYNMLKGSAKYKNEFGNYTVCKKIQQHLTKKNKAFEKQCVIANNK